MKSNELKAFIKSCGESEKYTIFLKGGLKLAGYIKEVHDSSLLLTKPNCYLDDEDSQNYQLVMLDVISTLSVYDAKYHNKGNTRSSSEAGLLLDYQGVH